MHDVLSYDDLRDRAKAILDEHHPTRALPIPIEEIVEIKAGIEIVVLEYIRDECDTDAFILHDCSAIYVDRAIFMHPNDNRYRFSLAHEFAHSELHAPIMAEMDFTNLQKARESILAVRNSNSGSWIEWQAYALAGLILVPPEELAREHNAAVNAISAGSPLTDPDVFQVETQLATTFQVSTEVISRRCRYDKLGN